MDFYTVLDISSIIWDKEDYNTNTNEYYNLITAISTFLNKIEKEKPKILLREALQLEMIEHFPFDNLPNMFYEFGNIVYSFLGNIGSDIITYPNNILTDIVSIPDQIKEHYKSEIKDEVSYLISKIHSDDKQSNIYFTFKYLWNGNDKLSTQIDGEVKEYETIISDDEDKLDIFFNKYKLIFQHNEKHNKTIHNTKEKWENEENKNEFVSRLSCYNGVDNKEPQRILDEKYPIEIQNRYFGYDNINNVFVVFKCHSGNKYHGYDEYDEENIEKIPLIVRKHFNK